MFKTNAAFARCFESWDFSTPVCFGIRYSIFGFLLWILPAVSAFAGARHFTYLYEAVTSPPGSVELENTITWAQTTGATRLDEVDFREELEIGITNHFQLGLYPLDWNYRHGDQENGFSYDGGAAELIYNLTNPVVDPAGIALYEEIKAGDRRFELESKLIVQKNFGPLILDYNATLEAEWAGDSLEENDGELQQALGASYEISPRVSVGLEMIHEFVFPGWRDQKKIRKFLHRPERGGTPPAMVRDRDCARASHKHCGRTRFSAPDNFRIRILR